RIADGPMSTPRRPAPRSRPAPMIATGRGVSRADIRKTLDGPRGAELQLCLGRVVQLDAERRKLGAGDQVVELVGEAVETGRGPPPRRAGAPTAPAPRTRGP